ncbi:hypothetical protein [uncultured Chryseobacterium sp.]|uniref:hypothetical protein n=1 Tax=uncultured Chryseobacterium sp. TaxID=259322 RepID=UPI0025EF2F06|nr:hypothetical protein [uncultured Chryseobacterium sp.]
MGENKMNYKILNFKTIILLIFNAILLYLTISGYKDLYSKQAIMKNQKPVTVQILDTFGGRGRSSCKVKYNNHIYNGVTLPNPDLKIGSINSEDFYYNSEKDIVFSNNLQSRSIYFIMILFVASLLLWMIPKKYL